MADLDYTNGEIKTLLAAVCRRDPEKISGWLVLLLDEAEGVQLVSGATREPLGRQGEVLLLLHALAKINERLVTEVTQHRQTLIQLGLLAQAPGVPEPGDDTGWTA